MSIDAKMKDACLDKSFQRMCFDFSMHLHVLKFPCTHLTRAGGLKGERQGQGSQVRASGSVRPVREFIDFRKNLLSGNFWACRLQPFNLM